MYAGIIEYWCKFGFNPDLFFTVVNYQIMCGNSVG